MRRAKAESLTKEDGKAIMQFLRSKGCKNALIAEEMSVHSMTVSGWATGRTTAPKTLVDFAKKEYGYEE